MVSGSGQEYQVLKRVKKDKVSVNRVRERRRKLGEEMGVINCKSSRGPR